MLLINLGVDMAIKSYPWVLLLLFSFIVCKKLSAQSGTTALRMCVYFTLYTKAKAVFAELCV